MRVLYAAELVGKAGVHTFKTALPELKRRYSWDVLVACADGASGGNGLGRNHAAYLHSLGAKVLTTGDCCFFKKDLTENLDTMPYVLRPENLNPEAPGIGAKLYKVGEERLAVVQLIGQNGFSRLHGGSPFVRARELLERLREQTPYVLVDFHAQATAEKKTLFFLADGLCSAVIGSHTRVQTADECILPGGTAVITDAGRTGSLESVGGFQAEGRIGEYRSGIPEWPKEAWGKTAFQGVLVEIGPQGKALSIERISLETGRHQKVDDES